MSAGVEANEPLGERELYSLSSGQARRRQQINDYLLDVEMQEGLRVRRTVESLLGLREPSTVQGIAEHLKVEVDEVLRVRDRFLPGMREDDELELAAAA